MEKATPWTLFVCKLISCIPSSGNDSRVKEQLLETYRENPDPQEMDLAKFQTVIKHHESLMTAKEFKGAVCGSVRRVTEDPPKQPGKPHFLCNKIHKRGSCTQQCSGCQMFGSHLEEKCWTLHSELKPKFETSKKRRGRERGRSR